MNKSQVVEIIINIMKTNNIIKGEVSINEEGSLSKEYGVNSLHVIQLIVGIEEQFNLEFNDTELMMANFDTISCIADVVLKQLSSIAD